MISLVESHRFIAASRSLGIGTLALLLLPPGYGTRTPTDDSQRSGVHSTPPVPTDCVYLHSKIVENHINSGGKFIICLPASYTTVRCGAVSHLWWRSVSSWRCGLKFIISNHIVCRMSSWRLSGFVFIFVWDEMNHTVHNWEVMFYESLKKTENIREPIE